MKIGWLYKRDRDDEQWEFSKTEPDSWVWGKTMIVYMEVIE